MRFPCKAWRAGTGCGQGPAQTAGAEPARPADMRAGGKWGGPGRRVGREVERAGEGGGEASEPGQGVLRRARVEPPGGSERQWWA